MRHDLASVIELDRARRDRETMMRSSVAAVGGLIAALAGAQLVAPWLYLTGAALAVVGAPALLLIGLVGRRAIPTFSAGSVEIGGDLLTLQNDRVARRILRRDVSAGWLDPAGAVHLLLADRTEYVLEPTAPGGGPALLEALGLATHQRATTFSVASRLERVLPSWIALPLMVILAVVSTFFALSADLAFFKDASVRGITLGMTIFAALTCLLALKGRQMFGKRALTVGTDGVRVQGATSHFIPRSRIASVEDAVDGLDLQLTDGTTTHLAYDRDRGDEDRASLKKRLEEMLRGTGQAPPPEALASALDRGDRSVAEWRERLTRLAGSEAGYRAGRLDGEALAGLVEDGSVGAERRIGAAIALAASGDARAKERIRIAAAASTDDEMRAALEDAADGEIAESRLAELERRMNG